MATAKERLKTKPAKNSDNAGQTGLSVQMQPPTVKIGAPQVTVQVPPIKIPEIKIPAADMRGIASAIDQITAAMRQIAEQQNRILGAIQQQNDLMARLADREPAAPTVKMPARAGAYNVEIERDDDGATIGMRIEAERTH